jgi:hypothetical protein
VTLQFPEAPLVLRLSKDAHQHQDWAWLSMLVLFGAATGRSKSAIPTIWKAVSRRHEQGSIGGYTAMRRPLSLV